VPSPESASGRAAVSLRASCSGRCAWVCLVAERCYRRNGADAEASEEVEEAGVGDTRESPPKLKEIASASGATRSGFRESGLPPKKGFQLPCSTNNIGLSRIRSRSTPNSHCIQLFACRISRILGGRTRLSGEIVTSVSKVRNPWSTTALIAWLIGPFGALDLKF